MNILRFKNKLYCQLKIGFKTADGFTNSSCICCKKEIKTGGRFIEIINENNNMFEICYDCAMKETEVLYCVVSNNKKR